MLSAMTMTMKGMISYFFNVFYDNYFFNVLYDNLHAYKSKL